MKNLNFKKEVSGEVEDVVKRVTAALQAHGFGILTRIDFHAKIKEKLGEDLSPVVILGACNPRLAYEAYRRNSDVTSLIPCNAVVRDLGSGRTSVELALPSALLGLLGDADLTDQAKTADAALAQALEKL